MAAPGAADLIASDVGRQTNDDNVPPKLGVSSGDVPPPAAPAGGPTPNRARVIDSLVFPDVQAIGKRVWPLRVPKISVCCHLLCMSSRRHSVMVPLVTAKEWSSRVRQLMPGSSLKWNSKVSAAGASCVTGVPGNWPSGRVLRQHGVRLPGPRLVGVAGVVGAAGPYSDGLAQIGGAGPVMLRQRAGYVGVVPDPFLAEDLVLQAVGVGDSRRVRC